MAGTKEACLLLFVGFFVLTSAEPHHYGRYNFYEAFRSRFLCRFKRCHRYAECEVQNNTAVCVCPKVCSKKYSPVCGTNWKTYNNFCELARASCLADSRLRLRYYGPCKSGSCRRTHWQRLRCPYRSRCELVYGLPRCSCPKTCSFAYKPVCGSNGRTYRNSCELRKAACKGRKWLYVKHPGHCRPDPCARIDCCCGAQCRVNETNHARCACEFACTLQYDPVCGSDGKTYGNACGLRSAACVEQNPGLRVVSKGRCEDVSTTPQNGTTEPPPVITTAPPPEVSTTPQNGTTEPPPGTTEPPATTSNPCARCRFYSICDLRKVPPACVCPSPCGEVFKPVCGSNGVTFGNVCELQRDSCKSQLLIEVVSQGPCPTPTSNVTNPVA